MQNLLEHFDTAAFPELARCLQQAAVAQAMLGDTGHVQFLDTAEILARRAQIEEDNSDFLNNILFIAEDRGGVLYGPWIRGRAAGMWTMLDPGEIDISPAWRSAADFAASCLANEGLPRATLPDVADAATPEEHKQWAFARELYIANFEANYAADPEGMFAIFFAYSTIALTPRSEAASLMRFLTVDNQWIAERAAVALGDYRYLPAVDALKQLAASSGNGALAARSALRNMGVA